MWRALAVCNAEVQPVLLGLVNATQHRELCKKNQEMPKTGVYLAINS